MIRLLLPLLLLIFSSAAALAQRSPSEERVVVRGLLVAASAQPGPTDERLRPYESTLRRILRFESFQHLGGGGTTLAIPAQGNVVLGHGHRLELTTEPAREGAYRVQINWVARGQSLMRTGLMLRPGVPVVLGGPARGDGSVFAVLLVAQ